MSNIDDHISRDIISYWKRVTSKHIPEYDPIKVEDKLVKMASMLIPGKFYFYLLNFQNLNIDFVSKGVEEVLGVNSKHFNINSILNHQTKESLQKFHQKEQFVADFLFNYLKPEQIPNYKVQYFIEMKDTIGNVKTIMHQVNTLKVSENGKVEHVMGIHTDVSHLNMIATDQVSFIHQKDGTSFHHLDYSNGQFLPPEKKQEKGIENLITDRELEVLQCIVEGKNSHQTGQQLKISKHTVDTIRRKVIKKFESQNIQQVVTICLSQNLLNP